MYSDDNVNWFVDTKTLLITHHYDMWAHNFILCILYRAPLNTSFTSSKYPNMFTSSSEYPLYQFVCACVRACVCVYKKVSEGVSE